MNTVPAPEEVESLMATLRLNSTDSRLWLRLCLALAPTQPMAALAAAQRALDTCDYELLAHSADDSLSYRATRRHLRLPIRGILIELLLQMGYKAAASIHFHIYRESFLKTPTLVVPIPTPRLTHWLESPWLAHANHTANDHTADDTPEHHLSTVIKHQQFNLVAAQLRVYSWRMLMTNPPRQVPAVVVSRKHDRVKLALLSWEHTEEAQRVVRASQLAFPSLAGVPAGTPMQLLIGRLTPYSLPRVLGVAGRPNGTRWERTTLVAGVVFWVMPPKKGVRTIQEAGAVVVVGPTAKDRIWVSMVKFAKFNLTPQVGDAIEMRLLQEPNSFYTNPIILTIETPIAPNPAVWRPFYGHLRIENDELGFIENSFRIFRASLPGQSWHSGLVLSGIAVPFEDTLHNRILWQAIRVEVERG